MSLRYSASTGRLWATDDTVPGDPIVFDTNDGLLFVDPADVFTGSISVPARTASSSGVDGSFSVVDVERDYFIGIPSAFGARYVRGMIRTGTDAVSGLWRQAGGTHITSFRTIGNTPDPGLPIGPTGLHVSAIRGYTFFVNELGHLVMRERCVIRAQDPAGPPTSTLTLGSATIDFRLMVGTFFGADFSRKPGLIRRGNNAILNSGNSSGTVTNLDFGYAYTGRQLLAVINSYNIGAAGRTLNSCSIGGVSATILGGIGAQSGNDCGVYLAIATVPTGESGNVATNWSGGISGLNVTMYQINNFVGSPTIQTNSVNNTALISQTITVGANQIGLAVVGKTADGTGGDEGTHTWVNAEEQVPAFRQASAIVPENSGSVNVQQTWSFARDQAMVTAVWS